MTAYTLENREDKKAYFLTIGNFHPKVEYIRTSEKIYLTHTEVPKELSGQGIGGQLVEMVLKDIEGKGLTVIPLCPFVAGYIKSHPEWNKILDKSVNLK